MLTCSVCVLGIPPRLAILERQELSASRSRRSIPLRQLFSLEILPTPPQLSICWLVPGHQGTKKHTTNTCPIPLGRPSVSFELRRPEFPFWVAKSQNANRLQLGAPVERGPAAVFRLRTSKRHKSREWRARGHRPRGKPLQEPAILVTSSETRHQKHDAKSPLCTRDSENYYYASQARI